MELKSNRIFGNELKYLKEILETDFRTSAFGVMAKVLDPEELMVFPFTVISSTVNSPSVPKVLIRLPDK